MKTLEILDTPLTVTNYEEFIQFCHGLAGQPGATAVDLTNTQIVTFSSPSPTVLLQQSDLCLGGSNAKLKILGISFFRGCSDSYFTLESLEVACSTSCITL